MIKKPNVVKGIPPLLVRALPTIYYYGRFASETVADRAKSMFESYVQYLVLALKKTEEVAADHQLTEIINQVEGMLSIPSDNVESEVYKITSELSKFCQNNSKIKEQYSSKNGLKQAYLKLFCDIVKKTRVLLIDNSNQPDWAENLTKRLEGSCYYDVMKTKIEADKFSDEILENDFVVFASATPQTIHEDVNMLQTYHKPGLILGNLSQDSKLNQQTIRNGAWLRKSGYNVLFKIFSPLRLFTTIDKINIRYLLQQG